MRVEQSAAWGDFVAMQEALHARLAGELQSGSSLSEADYAVLAVLNRRRQISTRPHELAATIQNGQNRVVCLTQTRATLQLSRKPRVERLLHGNKVSPRRTLLHTHRIPPLVLLLSPVYTAQLI